MNYMSNFIIFTNYFILLFSILANIKIIIRSYFILFHYDSLNQRASEYVFQAFSILTTSEILLRNLKPIKSPTFTYILVLLMIKEGIIRMRNI